jgi:peptide/nickel transport system permease protein
VILAIFYFTALFCEFFSPIDPAQRDSRFIYAPPQSIHFFADDGFHFRPFVYGIKGGQLDENWMRQYEDDTSKILKLCFFVKGTPYRIWGLIPWDRHFIGIAEQDEPFYLIGADHFGRDQLGRVIYGSRVSLSIGLVGVFMSLVIGCFMGGISGYFGGAIDNVIQRIIELLMSLPTLPLWMGLAAALPATWSPLQVYFGMVIILSLIGWTGLARVVRGKIMSLREEDFAMAARLAGASELRIIRKHLLPSFFSYLIVNITLSVPGMILAETSLSYLGLGLRPPVISWGVLLQQAQSVQVITNYPWIMWPGAFVIVIVLAFNFVGDGMRDAADPYVR